MNDKKLHLLAGVIIAASMKEYFDYHINGNRWDWRDLLATCIGVAIAVLFILGLHYGKG